MNREEKKRTVEDMAEKFMSIENKECRSIAILIMHAYVEGITAGREEQAV